MEKKICSLSFWISISPASLSFDYTKKAEYAFCIQLASQNTGKEHMWSELLLCSHWNLDDCRPSSSTLSDPAESSAAFKKGSPTMPSASAFGAACAVLAVMFLMLCAKTVDEA